MKHVAIRDGKYTEITEQEAIQAEREQAARFAYDYADLCGKFDFDPGTLAAAINRFDVSPIIFRSGAWAFTEYGIEYLADYYPIEKERIFESDWLDHLSDKKWFCWACMIDFRQCLRAAQKAQNEVHGGER